MQSNSTAPGPGKTLLDRGIEWLCASEPQTRRLRRGLLLCAAAYLVLVGWAETGPVNRFGNDVPLLLDAGWRIVNGQKPYADFFLALGPVEGLLTALGMRLTHGSPHCIALGSLVMGLVVGAWGWQLARRRMPAVPALLATAWLILMATSPTPIGFLPSVVSCAMIYNRHGYALLGLVFLECAFAEERGRFWSGVSSGAALGLLAMLKLNFLAAALLPLLVTIPLKRQQWARGWGILAGLGATAALFGFYLRGALGAFFSDMRVAAAARAPKMNLVILFAEIPRSAEMVTLAVLTLIVTALAWRGRGWPRAAVTTLLLGGLVILTGAFLTETNTGETGCPMGGLWTIVLLGMWTAAYPHFREKTAFAAVAALCLGGVAAELALHGESLMTLAKYQLPPARAAGATLRGEGMQSLRFYDSPGGNLDGDNGPHYVDDVNDGVDLLTRLTKPQETVQVVGFHNPFSYLLRRKPARGGSPWFLFGNNIPTSPMLDAELVFGDAALIMVPHYPSSHAASDARFAAAYETYLTQHYAPVASSASWSLYRRKP